MPELIEVTCNHRVNPIGVGANPVFAWKLKDAARQQSYRIYVWEGKNAAWDSGEILSNDTCGIEYGGTPLKARTQYRYRVAVTADGVRLESGEQTFETALLNGFSARWLAQPPNFAGYATFARNVKYLRDTPVRARMYISGIGYYEVRVNGKKVGKSVLNPGVTDYSRHILYDTYDVTDLYRAGENLTGVVLGNGWYGMQKLICEIHFVFADGGTDRIETNGQMDWFFTGSPITRQSIYGGETYDARREALVDGWDGSFRKIDYFQSGWMFSVYADEPSGTLVPQENEPIEVAGSVPVSDAVRISDTVTVYDFGVIFAGWAKLTVRGARGAAVTLRYAEGLKADGTVDQLNLRSAEATDRYILKGEGTECWAPRFTYHGFRYVQAETEGAAEILSLEGEAVRSAVRQIGHFSCSDPVLNRLHENAVRTEASNMHSIPTDCPQRDERFGWLNDLTTRLDQALYNFDVSAFYEKFARDIEDTQDECGAIADTAPYKTGSRPADPVAVSYLLIPLRLFERYGNRRAVRARYPGCRRWVDYLLSLSEKDLLSYGIYGDWAPPAEYAIPGTPCNRLTEPALVSGAYLFWYCNILAKLAEAIGEKEDAFRYRERAARIREAYNRAYFDEEKGHYRNETQAGNAIPLNLGICPEEYRAAVAAFISEDIAAHGGHLTTGNQAYKHMLEALGDMGYARQLVRMIVNPDYPGWGYMIRSGATSIWERWEAEMASEMNSFCHPMHGSIDSWFYGWLAGIRFAEDAVGGDKLVIRPHTAGLDFAEASVESARGRISVSWKREKQEISFLIEIPSCTTAVFWAPGEILSPDGGAAGTAFMELSAGRRALRCRAEEDEA